MRFSLAAAEDFEAEDLDSALGLDLGFGAADFDDGARLDERVELGGAPGWLGAGLRVVLALSGAPFGAAGA